MDPVGGSVTFGKKRGFFISRKVAIVLAITFVACLVAVGLLVFFLAPTEESTNMLTTTPRPEVTTTSPITKLNVRLPRSLEPIHYVVRLQPFIHGNFSIVGHVEIEFRVLEETSNVTLHILDIITKNETVKVEAVNSVRANPGITKQEYDVERQFYVAHLDTSLKKDDLYVIKMDFVGILGDKMAGFYRSSYTDGSQIKWLAATQFQPTDARRAFPCFDEPGLKATFDISIAREKNMTAISNMPLSKTVDVPGHTNWVWDHFNKTVPMSTYLIAFVVSDFAQRESNADETLFRVWAREKAIDQAAYALASGPSVLSFFESFFNIPFPLPKQDMIALPDFSAGAMENWGLITYRETAMLYDETMSSVGSKQRVCVVVAHELAHQWFGNLVTPKWWTDIWLNEGFASYMEFLGVTAVEPTWNMMEQFVIEDLQDVFGLDWLESSHPISIEVGHPDEIGQIFDRISYGKGASIIRMMDHFLTRASFQKGLTNYLTKLAYTNAEQDDLWFYLTEAAHEDENLDSSLAVKEIMDTWTLQMGYPVLTVNRSTDGKTAILEQSRFLLVKNVNSTDTHEYKWHIPITHTNQDELNFLDTKPKQWLKKDQTTATIEELPAKNKWVIFNVQQSSYYRVNYDVDNWNLLLDQLEQDHEKIDVANRAQLIDDAMDLARAGVLSYDIAMRVNSYLSKEKAFVPWASSTNNLGYIKGMLVRTSTYGPLKNYLLSLIVPYYESFGFDDLPGDEHLDQLNRNKARSWACSLRHPDCMDRAKTKYQSWMSGVSLTPNERSTVLCVGIEEGSELEWDFAWGVYNTSNLGTEKDEILSALGCTQESWLLSKYMDMAFTDNSGIRRQDSARAFSSVAYNIIGRPLAWDFLRDQWDRINSYFGGGFMSGFSGLIRSASNNFNTELHLRELLKLQADNEGSLGSASRAVEQAIEKTRHNIAWMKNSHETIAKWLQDNSSN